MTQSEVYSEINANLANTDLAALGLPDWSQDSVKAFQARLNTDLKINGYTVKVEEDGWLGPKTIEAWKTFRKVRPLITTPSASTSQGEVIVGGVGYVAPTKLVNFLDPHGIPSDPSNTNHRTRNSTQFVFHRGAETRRASESYAEATERILDSRGLSTTFTMDIDGTIYQHFDPALHRGRHCSFHNVQSDSLDIAGPFSLKRKGLPGQTQMKVKMAIGKSNDKVPPLTRPYRTVKCWSLTPMQVAALVAFVPWYCALRGIPLRACSDWRSFRIGGADLKDPVTNVTGLLAHTQVSDPGRRVDGVLPLLALKDSGVAIEWRTGDRFLEDSKTEPVS